jgi:predicted esterase
MAVIRPLLFVLSASLLFCFGCDESSSGPKDAAGPGRDAVTQLDGAPDGVPADTGTPTPDHSSPSPDLTAGGPKALPKPTKPCPKLTEGLVTILGVTVRLWVGSKPPSTKGPLVFYWHGTASNPGETIFGLGQKNIDAIKAQGGLVAAPKGPTALTGAQTGGIVWKSGDFALADEILACALQQVGIDARRVHSVGLSAGGLHTAQMSYTRSGYLASVVTYSGGLIPIFPPPPSQDPANKLAAMIMHGGVTDQLGSYSFKVSSERYLKFLQGKGQFAFVCDHGKGHWLPPGGGAATWRFFQDHPFGTSPSPYKGGLPASIPTYCKL